MNLRTIKFLIYKIITYFIVFFIAITINFFLTRLIPGNALSTLIAALSGAEAGLSSSTAAGGASVAQLSQEIHQLEAEFGLLPQPWYVEYFHYLKGIFTGNLGVSITYYPLSVIHIISSSIGITLGEALIASISAYFLGSWLGSIFAIRRGTKSGTLADVISAILITIPAFVIIMYLELAFSVNLKLVMISFPGVSLTPKGILNLINFYIIPMIGFIVSLMPGFYFGMRNTMVHTLRDNYVNYAEILGFKRSTIRKFVSRNSMLPNITNFSITVGFGISSALTIEGLLAVPGTGYYLGNALLDRDLPLLQGIFLIIVVMLIISLAIIEIVYGLLDPRVRGGQG
ncbi:sugar ABC transporter permease [Sulfolobus sp. A20]|uniref:ABC transporter permease n=1 Tax=Saccharolobus sp. A20 TaxID=1891280 RepID=UPI000845F275|nr:ABC transporter permease [Sulfolobus sp. A20]AOL17736.1 sugar ABC transporter permease [Sulfolobus sp. A20]TRN04083.1 ABC transporter permease [Sulfolobus sp. F1]